MFTSKPIPLVRIAGICLALLLLCGATSAQTAGIGSCTIEATSQVLGSGCGNFMGMDPILTVPPPVLGTTIDITLESNFPGALYWIFFSLGQPATSCINSLGDLVSCNDPSALCTIYVDLGNLNNLALLTFGYTDANGNATVSVPIPNVPAAAGLEVTFQARMCAPNAPIQGPFNDWFSNGVLATLGCKQVCLVIIDEDTIDNGFSTIQAAASSHGVTPDYLVNDDMPTETSNPWLRWNQFWPGDIVVLPSGEVDDEGWFALPPNPPFNVQDYVNGTVVQAQLDPIPEVMPLRNHELFAMIGQTCVAVVYDSDISMNYLPIQGNLQGARYGLFAFTVLDVQLAGALPESTSDTALYDIILKVEAPIDPTFALQIPIRDHEPDSAEITLANYSGGAVTVYGESDFSPSATMTVSIENFILEAPMTYNASQDRYEFTMSSGGVNLNGRRVTISTDEGGAYNDIIQ